MPTSESKNSDWILPDFASETEEAKWWYENQDLVGKMFEQAARDGTLRHGTLANKYGLKPSSAFLRNVATVSGEQRNCEEDKG
jgi:hypothetical protein